MGEVLIDALSHDCHKIVVPKNTGKYTTELFMIIKRQWELPSFTSLKTKIVRKMPDDILHIDLLHRQTARFLFLTSTFSLHILILSTLTSVAELDCCCLLTWLLNFLSF